MSMHFRALAEQAAADGTISADEVMALRRKAWPDGVIDADEAEAILVINDLVQNPSPEWTDFVVEAVGEFVINGSAPKGYVSDETAEWLIGRLDHDGRLDSMTELALIVRILEKALGAPDRLKTYALVQIERAVVFGSGPTRDGGTLEAGYISPAECQLLRRVIFASGGDGPGSVSKAEAEMLFRIKDATLDGDNAPEWERLFVQGVGNYLQGWHGAKGLTRERAAELEAFMNDRTGGFGLILGGMLNLNTEVLVYTAQEMLSTRTKSRDVMAEARADAAVTGPEQLWLNAQIDGDDKIDALEQALLKFLQEG